MLTIDGKEIEALVKQHDSSIFNYLWACLKTLHKIIQTYCQTFKHTRKMKQIIIGKKYNITV